MSWQSNNFPFFRPTNGTITCTLPLWAPSWPPTSKSKNPPLVHNGPLKWPHQSVGVLNPNSSGHTKAWENFARRVPDALTYSLYPPYVVLEVKNKSSSSKSPMALLRFEHFNKSSKHACSFRTKPAFLGGLKRRRDSLRINSRCTVHGHTVSHIATNLNAGS